MSNHPQQVNNENAATRQYNRTYSSPLIRIGDAVADGDNLLYPVNVQGTSNLVANTMHQRHQGMPPWANNLLVLDPYGMVSLRYSD